jgi:cytochrome c5
MSRFLSAALCALFVCSASSTAFAAGDAAKGQAVYDGTCATCHKAGIGGAPKTGDKVAWAPRIKKGEAALVTSAIKGFKTPGSTGMAMLPKGGKATLTDAEVTNSVAYIIKQSK